MTTSQSGTVEQSTAGSTAGEDARLDGPLRAFTGEMISPMVFEDGRSVWLYNMTDTPTEFDGYREIWVTEPDGSNTLYTDPADAIDVVSEYHDFVAKHGADITWHRSVEELHVSMEAENGMVCDAVVDLRNTWTMKLVSGLSTVLPDSLDPLTDEGVSETGADYRFEPERVVDVSDASVSIDGKDLGNLEEAVPPGEYGEPGAPAENFFTTYDLYLPYPFQ